MFKGSGIIYLLMKIPFVLYAWVTYYKYNTTRKRALLYLLTYSYGVIGALIAGRLYAMLMAHIGEKDNPVILMFGSIIFTPLFIIATVAVEKGARKAINKKRAGTNKPLLADVSIRDTVDLLAPEAYIGLGFAKLTCHFDGCHFGIPWAGGIYNTTIKTEVFPIQIVETLVIFACLAVCYYLKQCKFYRRGMAYPMTTAFYALTRFFLEYLRYYNDRMRHLIFGMTIWQFAYIPVFVISIASMVILYKKYDSSPLPTRRSLEKQKNKKPIVHKKR